MWRVLSACARLSCGLLLGAIVGEILASVLVQDYSHKKGGIDLKEQQLYQQSVITVITATSLICGGVTLAFGKHAKFAVLGGAAAAAMAAMGISICTSAPAHNTLINGGLWKVIFENGAFWILMIAGACAGLAWSQTRTLRESKPHQPKQLQHPLASPK